MDAETVIKNINESNCAYCHEIIGDISKHACFQVMQGKKSIFPKWRDVDGLFWSSAIAILILNGILLMHIELSLLESILEPLAVGWLIPTILRRN